MRVAVVGKSGAGKSTLTRLLFRFYDVQKGSVEIDGQDIRHITQYSLRNILGIAHRLSSIVHADLIVVMEDGRIIEQGKHQSLLKKKGLYTEMWQAQQQ